MSNCFRLLLERKTKSHSDIHLTLLTKQNDIKDNKIHWPPAVTPQKNPILVCTLHFQKWIYNSSQGNTQSPSSTVKIITSNQTKLDC